MYKGIKLRIYPNPEQQIQIINNFGAARFIWNTMLDMQIKRYKNNQQAPFVNGFGMNYLLKQLKQEYPWLKESDSTSLQDTCETLAIDFKRFFKHLSGYPKFKSRKCPKQSYKSRMISGNIKLVNNHKLQLPKLGTVRFKGREVTGKIKSTTIKLSPTGKFYAVLLIECENQAPMAKTHRTVGLDMGVSDLVITSDGIKYPTIRFDKRLSKQKHYWEKRLARRRLQAQRTIIYETNHKVLAPKQLSDFKNYVKAKLMFAKYSEKITNQRRDYLHKISLALVKAYDVIKLEDLKTKNLLHNHHLACAIANQSWRELRMMLTYKAKWYSKQVMTVSPYKTSQICSNCGYDDGKHTLDIRAWVCPNCGAHLDRDINAAKNILMA